MTQAPTRARLAGHPPSSGPRAPARSWPWRSGLLLAVRTTALGVLAVEFVTLLLWATEQGTGAGAGDALRTGLLFWLAAHHTGFAVTGGHFGVTPYGLTLLPALLLAYGARRIAQADPPRDGRAVGRLIACSTAVYATLTTLLCLPASQPGVHPVLPQALLGSAVLCAIAVTAGAWPHSSWRPQWPAWLLAVGRSALLAVLAVLGAGAVAMTAALVARHGAVTATGHAVAPGVSGTLGLALINLLAVPTAVIDAACVLLGPGFGVGAGTNVGLGGVTLGSVPALPVLGAVPGAGAFPSLALVVLAIPVGAGVVAGLRALRGELSTRHLFARVLAVAGATGIVFAVLAWLVDGPSGPGKLAVTGPSPWRVGLAAFLEIGAGALIVAVVKAQRRRSRRGDGAA